MQPHNTISHPLFMAEVENATPILQMFQAIFVEEKPASVMEVDMTGFRVIVEVNKVLQGTAYIKKNLFKKFVYNGPAGESVSSFRIDLRHFLKCIGIFPTSSIDGAHWNGFNADTSSMLTLPTISLKLRMVNLHQPLELEVSDGGISTKCSINTIDSEAGFAPYPGISEENLASRMIIDGELMRDVTDDFDVQSEFLGVEVENSEGLPKFHFKMVGIYGESDIVLSKKDPTDDGISIICTVPTTQQFRMAMFKKTLKCLRHASKVVIRTSTQGLFAIKYRVEFNQDTFAFIEYLLCEKDNNSMGDVNDTTNM